MTYHQLRMDVQATFAPAAAAAVFRQAAAASGDNYELLRIYLHMSHSNEKAAAAAEMAPMAPMAAARVAAASGGSST